MPNWNTNKIYNRAEQICETLNRENEALDPPHLRAEIHEAGGDHDTNSVVLVAGQSDRPDSIPVCAFDEVNVCADKDNLDATMIEMNSGRDSRGGIMVNDESLMIAGFRLQKSLEKDGWCIVPQMKDYF